MPRVIVPPPFQGPTRGEREIKVQGRILRECLEAVDGEYPGFLPQVVREDGTAQHFVKLFVNGEQLVGGNLDVALEIDDEIEILVAVGGG
jgi:hypothetical protein